MILTPKVRKTLNIILRFSIAIFAISYLVYRVSIIPAYQVELFIKNVFNGDKLNEILFLIVALLFVNIGLEAFKWKILIDKTETISISNSAKAVLGGMAVSVFTPNRVGEFLGRVFILKKTDPLQAILLTIVGSVSQLLVTILAGTMAYLLFAPVFLSKFLTDSIWLINGFSFTLVFATIAYVFLFFNISALHRLSFITPLKYSEQIKNGIEAIASIPRIILFKILSISALRYVIFSTQFFLSLRFMGLTYPTLYCFEVISLIYLALAAIPSIALSEIGVRGSVSVFLFGLIAGSQGLNNYDSVAVISAATFIWLVNIGLPSLVGVLVVFRIKFFKI